jgi:lauroyl/myristoyl acyltransferase
MRLDATVRRYPLLPVSLATVFGPIRTPAQIRAMSGRCLFEIRMNRAANRDLAFGARCREVRNAQAVLGLRRRGDGAVVCGFHLGPFHYATTELAHLDDGVHVFAADHLAKGEAAFWMRTARVHGIDVEILSNARIRSMIRAVRALKAGRRVVIYADAPSRLGPTLQKQDHTVDVEFLGLPFRMRMGPAFLSQRAEVPMIFAATYRDGLFRKVVEFSDPLAPPARRSLEAVAGRIREMYAWFEERVRRHPEQWDGWLHHLAYWSETGKVDPVSQDRWDEESRRIRGLLETDGRRVRLKAEKTHVAWVEGDRSRLIFHGPRRLLLKGTAASCDLLDAAYDATPLALLPGRVALDPDTLCREVARLVLAGLAEIDDGRRAAARER